MEFTGTAQTAGTAQGAVTPAALVDRWPVSGTPTAAPAAFPAAGGIVTPPGKYDVSAFSSIIVAVTPSAGGGAGGALVTPNWYTADGTQLGPNVTQEGVTVRNATGGQIYVAYQCLGPMLDFTLSRNGAPLLTFALFGSNNVYRSDGPYTPNLNGRAIFQGGVTGLASPYAGPAQLSMQAAAGTLMNIQFMDFTGANAFMTNNIGPTQAPISIWIPPNPITITIAGAAVVSLMAAQL